MGTTLVKITRRNKDRTMTTTTKPITYLSVYVLCPKTLTEEEETAVEQSLITLFKSKLESDSARLMFHCNAEDTHAQEVVKRIKTQYKDTRSTVTAANFTKDKKRAYVNRNLRILRSVTHVTLFLDPHRNMTQDFIRQEIEEQETQVTMRIFDMQHIVKRLQSKEKHE